MKFKRFLKSYSLLHAPKLLLIFSLCLEALVPPIPGIIDFMPLLLMMIAFYWSIYHPERLPYPFLFFIGFFQDIIFDEMLGLSSFILIVFSVLLRRTQKKLIHRGFLTLWCVFCLLIMAFEALRLLISAFSSPYVYMLETVLMQGIISAACYPCIHFLCSGILTIEHDNKRRYAK